MSSKVQLTARTGAALYKSRQESAKVEAEPDKASEEAEPAPNADLRLIIEDTGEPGACVYTVLDRRTGRIVNQLPREEVLRLREQDDYAAGAVFKGEA